MQIFKLHFSLIRISVEVMVTWSNLVGHISKVYQRDAVSHQDHAGVVEAITKYREGNMRFTGAPTSPRKSPPQLDTMDTNPRMLRCTRPNKRQRVLLKQGQNSSREVSRLFACPVLQWFSRLVPGRLDSNLLEIGLGLVTSSRNVLFFVSGRRFTLSLSIYTNDKW